MKLRRITLREIRMPLLAPFETSFGRTTERRILLVEADVDGIPGWGEVTAGENPFYNPETIDTARLVLADFIWPALRDRNFDSADQVFPALAHIRGHNMAKAGVETAIWDAAAKQNGVPLARLLGGDRREVASGISIGLQGSLGELLERVEEALHVGYQRIKIKIKPGNDVELAAAIRGRFPLVRLMVDANSAYRLEDAAQLKELDRYGLMMIEQPLAWNDIFSHVELQRRLDTPICLDECIDDERQARAAIELGACRIINIKLGRVGGHAQARCIQQLCRERSVPVWCGGMLESGIGRAHNIAMATLPGFVLPGDTSASRRYWQEDIIEPEVVVTRQGTIPVPAAPGIGFVPRLDRIDALTAWKHVLA